MKIYKINKSEKENLPWEVRRQLKNQEWVVELDDGQKFYGLWEKRDIKILIEK